MFYNPTKLYNIYIYIPFLHPCTIYVLLLTMLCHTTKLVIVLISGFCSSSLRAAATLLIASAALDPDRLPMIQGRGTEAQRSRTIEHKDTHAHERLCVNRFAWRAMFFSTGACSIISHNPQVSWNSYRWFPRHFGRSPPWRHVRAQRCPRPSSSWRSPSRASPGGAAPWASRCWRHGRPRRQPRRPRRRSISARWLGLGFFMRWLVLRLKILMKNLKPRNQQVGRSIEKVALICFNDFNIFQWDHDPYSITQLFFSIATDKTLILMWLKPMPVSSPSQFGIMKLGKQSPSSWDDFLHDTQINVA